MEVSTRMRYRGTDEQQNTVADDYFYFSNMMVSDNLQIYAKMTVGIF